MPHPRCRLWVFVLSATVLTTLCLPLLSASAQEADGYHEPRPLTPQEAQETLADFKAHSPYIAVTPGAILRSEGFTLSITSARVRHGKLFVTGTLVNETSSTIAGSFALDLNQNYEEQIAHYQKEPVTMGVCGGPCITSHMEASFDVPRLPVGKSLPFAVRFGFFRRTYPALQPKDTVIVPRFFPDKDTELGRHPPAIPQ